MARRASKSYGIDWSCVNDDGGVSTWENVQVILLQEIRDQLVKMNHVIQCHNFQDLPRRVQQINRRLATRLLLSGEKPKRKVRT
jgi:hypothetical protein